MTETTEATTETTATTDAPAAGDRLTAAQLRELFLFSELDDEQLAWISTNGDVVEVPMGEDVVTEADPATCFYVLLSGQIAMSRTVGGDRVETTRTDYRGVYFGAEIGRAHV